MLITHRTAASVAALVASALLVTGCGGDADDGEDGAAAPATTQTASSPDSTPAPSPGDPDDGEGLAASPTEAATEPGDDLSAAEEEAGDGTGPEGCPDQTELRITRRALEGEEEILPSTAFPVGHMILDLDGSGFGPTLRGVLSTDASEDGAALAAAASTAEAPSEGNLRIRIGLQGPGEGETTYPLGVYGTTEADGVFAPTEGMGLDTFDRDNPDGSSNPMNRDNQVELIHFGEGVVCGQISPTGREPGQSNPVTDVEGGFIATLTEQP